MKRLHRITVDRIMSWRPCSGLFRERVKAAFGDRFSLTPIQIAGLKMPPEYVLWILLREEIIPARELRLISCWCAERAMRVARAVGWEDSLHVQVLRTSRRFSAGRATRDELNASCTAAWKANNPAAGSAALEVGYNAALAVTVSAGAENNAWEAAWSASMAQAGAAAWATFGTEIAAWDIAFCAAQESSWAATFTHVKRVLRRLKKES